MNSFSLRSLVVAAVALGSSALARPVHALPLDFDALPVASKSKPPPRKSAPRFIPRAQVASGLHRFSSSTAERRRFPGFQEATLFDDATRAQEFEVQRKDGTEPAYRRASTCFSTPSNFRNPEEHDTRPLDWDVTSSDRFSAVSYSGDRGPKVVPVRAERWLENGAGVKLQTTNFWVDMGTGGTRLIDRTTVDLARVAVPFAGVAVYAQRTGPDSVSFLVRRDLPEPSPGTEFDPRALLRFAFGTSNGLGVDLGTLRTLVGEETRTSECAFQRVDLSVQPDATFDAAPVEVPDAPAEALRPPKPGFALLAFPHRGAETASVAFNVVVAVQPEAVSAPEASPGLSVSSPEVKGSASVRTMVINLGILRGARGKPPVPSVSYGWADRARFRSF